MNKFEKGFESPKLEVEKTKKLTREEVESRLANGENLENLNLTDLDLAGLNLEEKSFRGSDIRGMSLYREEEKEEIRTNIKGADFTNATIADLGREVFFGRVDAEGATFGFTEDLTSRRNRHIAYKKSGGRPEVEDTGEILNFNGSEGNFKKTKWINVDFGGGSGYESTFSDADLSESIMEGSDLTGIDFSTTKIDGIKIKDPMSLNGLIINEQQIPIMVQAIELTDGKAQREFLAKVKNKGPKKALEDFFLVVIVEIKK